MGKSREDDSGGQKKALEISEILYAGTGIETAGTWSPWLPENPGGISRNGILHAWLLPRSLQQQHKTNCTHQLPAAKSLLLPPRRLEFLLASRPPWATMSIKISPRLLGSRLAGLPFSWTWLPRHALYSVLPALSLAVSCWLRYLVALGWRMDVCCLECERGRSPWKTLPFLGRVVLVVVGLVFASEGRNDGGNGVLLPSTDDGCITGHQQPLLP